MIFDLHCHTLAVKDGEKATRNLTSYNTQDFINNIVNNLVSVIAITNHNKIDVNQFKELLNLVPKDTLILPGVELDLLDEEGDRFNFNLIFGLEQLKELETLLLEILGTYNPKNFPGISIDKFGKILEKYSFTKIGLIPTSSKPNNKGKTLSEYSQHKLKTIFSKTNSYSIFELGKNSFKKGNQTQTIYEEHKESWTIGTDAHNVGDIDYSYATKIKENIIFDSIEKYITYLKSIKGKTNKEDFENLTNLELLDPQTNKIIEKLNIKIANGINVFLGKYGTGKTVLLEAVKKKLEEIQGAKFELYSGGKSEENWDKLTKKYLDNFNETIKKEEINLSVIKQYIDNNILNKNLFSGKEMVDVLKRIKLSKESSWAQKYECWPNLSLDSKIITFSELSVEDYQQEVNNFEKKIQEVEEWYQKSLNYKNDIKAIPLSEDEKKLLENFEHQILLIKDKLINFEKAKQEVYCNEKLKSDFIIRIVKDVQNFINKKRGLKPIPMSINLHKYYVDKEKLKSDFEKIEGLEIEKVFQTHLGKISEEEDFKIKNCYKKTSKDIKGYSAMKGNTLTTKESIIKILIFVQKSLKKLYEKDFSILFFSELKENFESLLSKKQNVKISEFYIFKTVCVLNEKDMSGWPSTGQKKLLTIINHLNKEQEVYFLDEPEAFLDQSTTKNIILKRIEEISELNKTLIIATHNANLAIVTKPKSVIYKIYIPYSSTYKTYAGSFFSKTFANVTNVEDKIEDIRIELNDLLEGGKSLFEERIEFYG